MKTNTLKKKFVTLFTALVGLGLLICVLYFAFNFYQQYQINNTASITENNTEIRNPPSANSGGGEEVATGPGLPAQLIIPAININAKIIYVGLDSKGAVDTPKGPAEVAWYKLGPRPGDKGSAVLTGHFGPWQTGAHSVFDNLYKLKTGDKIYVKDDKGVDLEFIVTGSKLYQANESPEEVFNKNDGIYLNIITCSGDWLKDQKTYTERRVIFAKAVI